MLSVPQIRCPMNCPSSGSAGPGPGPGLGCPEAAPAAVPPTWTWISMKLHSWRNLPPIIAMIQKSQCKRVPKPTMAETMPRVRCSMGMSELHTSACISASQESSGAAEALTTSEDPAITTSKRATGTRLDQRACTGEAERHWECLFLFVRGCRPGVFVGLGFRPRSRFW